MLKRELFVPVRLGGGGEVRGGEGGGGEAGHDQAGAQQAAQGQPGQHCCPLQLPRPAGYVIKWSLT